MRYVAILLLVACAGEPVHGAVDATPFTTDAPIVDASPLSDAHVPDGPNIVECTTLPDVRYYNSNGELYSIMRYRMAYLGTSYPAGRIYVCGLDAPTYCENPEPNCSTIDGQWPVMRCHESLVQEDTEGGYWVMCGYTSLRDANMDGMLTPENEYNLNAYIRITP